MHDPAQHPAIIHTRLAAHVGRQQWRDPLPLRIGKPEEISHFTASPPGQWITIQAAAKAVYWVRTPISNPMDLRTIAALHGAGVEPNLLTLQEQQIALARDQSASDHDEAFAMEASCALLYEKRLESKALTLSPDQFQREREALREYRLVVRQDSIDGSHVWNYGMTRYRIVFCSGTSRVSVSEVCSIYISPTLA